MSVQVKKSVICKTGSVMKGLQSLKTFVNLLSLQLFGKPVTILENKTQKKSFDNAEPPKVIGYFQDNNARKLICLLVFVFFLHLHVSRSHTISRLSAKNENFLMG
jgi:hypothetical protein